MNALVLALLQVIFQGVTLSGAVVTSSGEAPGDPQTPLATIYALEEHYLGRVDAYDDGDPQPAGHAYYLLAPPAPSLTNAPAWED